MTFEGKKGIFSRNVNFIKVVKFKNLTKNYSVLRKKLHCEIWHFTTKMLGFFLCFFCNYTRQNSNLSIKVWTSPWLLSDEGGGPEHEDKRWCHQRRLHSWRRQSLRQLRWDSEEVWCHMTSATVMWLIRMCMCADDGEVYVWDVRSSRCFHRFTDDGCVKGTSIAASPNGQFLACG